MPSRLALFFALLLAAREVPAQEPITRMLPLEAGNVWEYAVTRYVATSDSSSFLGDGRERWTVLEATPHSGDSLTATVQQERWAADGSVRPAARCVFVRRIRAACNNHGACLEVEVRSEQGRCTVPGLDIERGASPRDFRIAVGFGSPPPYLIGGIPYEIEPVIINSERNIAIGQPVPDILVESHWLSGGDVGLLYVRWDHAAGKWTRGVQYALDYAEVGGVVYGTLPALARAAPEAPLTFGLEAVYPNPFRDRLHLRIAQPSAEPVTVEVFDLLGRRIVRSEHAEAAPGFWLFALDGATLASGVYVVRVAAGGAAVTRRVVRVE